MSEEFATPDDLHAARPDVPLDTIRRLCRAGRIPGAELVGRTWRIPADAAEAWAENYTKHARRPAPPPGDRSPTTSDKKRQR